MLNQGKISTAFQKLFMSITSKVSDFWLSSIDYNLQKSLKR